MITPQDVLKKIFEDSQYLIDVNRPAPEPGDERAPFISLLPPGKRSMSGICIDNDGRSRTFTISVELTD